MPEFPEVATVIAYLQSNLPGKVISSINIYHPKVYRGEVGKSQLNRILAGQTIKSVVQKGKNIIIQLSAGYLIAHLRMEGKFFYQPTNYPNPNCEKRHIGYKITFRSQSHLWFNDNRRFGTLFYAVNSVSLDSILSNVAPDPFDGTMTPDRLYNLAKKSKRMIKPFLLNQNIISGIGNIYADEVLFRCSIHPATSISLLKYSDWAEILVTIRLIFQRAIDLGGTTIFTFHNNFIDGKFKNELNVYARKDKKCRRCSTKIIKIKLGQRGTHFCPSCQKQVQSILSPRIYFLTGRICSGKTTLMHRLKKQKNAKLIFADDLINNLYLSKNNGWQFISDKYPHCIKQERVDKKALFQLIKKDPQVLQIIEKNLYSAFFVDLQEKIKVLLRQVNYSTDQQKIFIEVPYKHDVCEWLMKSKMFRPVIIYLVVDQEQQIKRLQSRNNISMQKATTICKIFNMREYKIASFKQVIINNNSSDVDKVMIELINKIYL